MTLPHFIYIALTESHRTTFNPRLTKLFFVTRVTRGVVATPSLDFPNRTPYEIGFAINR